MPEEMTSVWFAILRMLSERSTMKACSVPCEENSYINSRKAGKMQQINFQSLKISELGCLVSRDCVPRVPRIPWKFGDIWHIILFICECWMDCSYITFAHHCTKQPAGVLCILESKRSLTPEKWSWRVGAAGKAWLQQSAELWHV